MDEISVSDDIKKAAKSTWASLDVQGSGFELLGKPIVSRLENQDVTKTQVEKRTRRVNKENSRDAQIKDEIVLSSVTTTEKSKRDLQNQKYKVISRNVTANINLQKRDDFAKNKGQKYTSNLINVNKQYNKDDESEITSVSHISKKVIVDTKQKEKPVIIPRTRKPRNEKSSDNISESLSRNSQKYTINKQYQTKRAETKPRTKGEDESDFSSENLSNMSRRVIKETKTDKYDKTKNQRSQSGLNKRIVNTFNKGSKSYEESEKESQSSSHHYQRVTVNTSQKDNAKNKNKITSSSSPKEQAQKYLSRTIAITPSKDEKKKTTYEYSKYTSKDKNMQNQGYTKQINTVQNLNNQGQKLFSKNIVIQPVNAETKKGEYNNKYTQGIKSISTNDVKTADLLKGMKIFTKNIVIEPVQKTKYNIQSVSLNAPENKYSKQSGRSQVNKVYSKGAERRPWEIDSKNGEDGFFGRYSNDNEVFSEDMLRKIPGINENTKFYHKTITITPVIIPPPKFLQQ